MMTSGTVPRAARRDFRRRLILAFVLVAVAVTAMLLRTLSIRRAVPVGSVVDGDNDLSGAAVGVELGPAIAGIRIEVPLESLTTHSHQDEVRSWTVIDRISRKPIGGAYMFEMGRARRSASSELAVATSEHGTGKLEVTWTDHFVREGLVVVAEGYLPATLAGEALAAIRVIELDPGATYRARFSTVDGSPARGVRVRMSQARLESRFATRSSDACWLPAAGPDVAVYEGISDQEGLLSVAGLQAGEYWITLESDRYVATQVPGLRKIRVVQGGDIERIQFAYIGVIAIAENNEIVWLECDESKVEGRLEVGGLRAGVTRAMLAREISPRIDVPKHAIWIEALRDDPDVLVREMELEVQLADRDPYMVQLRFQSPRALTPYVLSSSSAPLGAPRHARVQFAAMAFDQALIPEKLVVAFLEARDGTARPPRRQLYNGETAYIEPGRYTVTYSAALVGRIPDAEFSCGAGDALELTAKLYSSYAIVDVAFRSELEDLPLGCDLTIQYGNGQTADAYLSSPGKFLVPAGGSIVLIAQRRSIEIARMSCSPQPGQVVTFEVPISEWR